MVKIAVLMSTYNGEKYLKQQIDSILNQEGDFLIDLYVRDDGSRDNTIRILEDYKVENKLNWYNGENLKPGKSFLHLLKNCGAYDYYAFADQDDYWESNKLQRGINALKRIEKPALYCSNAKLVNEKLEPLGRNVYKSQPKTDFKTVICAGGLLGCTMIFNDKLAEAVKRNEEYPQMVLHDFYLVALCVSIDGKVIYDSEPTMKYRQHSNNVVGVSHGIMGTLVGRIKDMIYKEPVGIANQAGGILKDYGQYITPDKRKWLNRVENYKKSIISRAALACTRETKYINKNMGMKLRISILLGNR